MPTNFDRAAIEFTSTSTFPISYSTLSLFDNIPHKDQIEVFRKDIESRWESVYSPATLTLTRNERNTFGLIKPEWITYDTVNKRITAITIPTNAVFTRDNGSTLSYPPISSESLRIKRKTINYDTLVEWVNGSRITADQLNLLASQLIGIGQENLHEIEKNIIKIDEAGIEYTTPTYVDSQIDILRTQINLSGSLNNDIDYNQRLIYLARAANQNVPTVLDNIRWNNTNNTLTAYLTGTVQTNNILEFRTNTNTLVNYFNGRGVLNNAGRIYFQSSTPTVDANDTGLLWWDSVGNVLTVWNGTSWQSVAVTGNVVSTDQTQTISGAKTFTASTTFTNAANYFGTQTAGTGTDTFTKTLTVRPTATAGTTCILKAGPYPGDNPGAPQTLSIQSWDGTSQFIPALTVSPTQVVVQPTLALGFSNLTDAAKGVVATLAGTQTISGQKTFTSANTFFTGSAIVNRNATAEGGLFYGRLLSDTTTDWANSSSGTIIANNNATSAQSIILYPDNVTSGDSTRTGIAIRPKNPAGNGRLSIDGDIVLTGNLIFADNTNYRVRNLGPTRIPGQWGRLYAYGTSTNTQGATGLASAIPEATVTFTPQATGNKMTLQITRTNTPYEHKYQIFGYTGAGMAASASYSTTISATQGSITVTPNALSGGLATSQYGHVVTVPANTTTSFTVELVKSVGTSLAYIEWTILQ